MKTSEKDCRFQKIATMPRTEFPSFFVSMVALIILVEKVGSIYGNDTFSFDKILTGISFSPYTKNPTSNKALTCGNMYSFQELKTMLEVVSTKFSRIITGSMDAVNAVKYVPNATYYNETCIITRTAEAAAFINRERNTTHLNVIVGIKRYNNNEGGERRTETEVNLAVEAFRIAEAIYPGTIEGFQFSDVLTGTEAAISGGRWLDYLRNATQDTDNIRVGVTVSLTTLEGINFTDDAITEYVNGTSEEKEPKFNLIAKSDFVTVKFFTDKNQAFNSPKQNLGYGIPILMFYKQVFDRIKPRIDMMGYTGWAGAGDHSFQNMEKMQEYWTAVNEYAVKHNFRMWLHEAFDNPGKANLNNDSPYYGWWRLKDNDFADNTTGYVENLLNPRNITFLPAKTETLPNDSANASHDNNVYIWVWSTIAVIVGAVIIMILLISLHKLHKKRSFLQNFVLSKKDIKDFRFGLSEKDIEIAEQGGEVEICRSAIQKPYDTNLEVPIDQFEIYWERILGAGQFSLVHMASLRGQSPKEVALKTPRIGCSSTALRGLLSEIKILTHLGQHPNIVSICGAYTAELSRGKIYVALELCTIGSLKKHLPTLLPMRTSNENHADEFESRIQEKLLRWSYEIATGMEHIGYKGVIHADLATRNVLLTREGIAKIADFGLSRRLYEYTQYVKKQEEPLPYKWMSIESLKRRQFSFQSDVWSFGVTLWEIFSLGSEPYPGSSYNADFIENLEKGTLRMDRPCEASPELYQIMLDCWRLLPNMRPTFATLKTKLSEILYESKYDVLIETVL